MIKKPLAVSVVFLLSLFLLSPSVGAAPAKGDKTSSVSIDDTDTGKTIEPQSYVIGPQNLLQIKIFGEAGTNQMYRVDEDGYIRHALAGRVKIMGLTVAEAEKQLEQKLDGDYIINPQVNIFVLEYSHFSIIGEVRKPGNYEISGRVSVIRAISMAGGFTPIANQRGVQIIRKTEDGREVKIGVDAVKIMEGNLSDEQDLQADDVVVIPKSFF